MPTKTELEAEIARLEGIVRAQSQALDALGRETLIRIRMPWAPHALTKAAAPYISGDQFNDPHRWQALVMQPAVDVLEQYAVRDSPDGKNWVSVKGELNFVDRDAGSGSRGEHYLTPELPARMIAALLDNAARFANEAYRKGVEHGSDMLLRLVEGETSADQFNESRQREIARDVQQHKELLPALERSITDRAERKAAEESKNRKP